MSKVYLAGEWKIAEGEMYVTAGVKRRLMSYFYHQRWDEDIQQSVDAKLDLFLDSGAFSAFTKGVKIDPKLYAQFIKDCKGIWTVHSSLDAIGKGDEAARASYDNLKILEKEGVVVSPVFHVREPDAWLRRYVDEGYPYIFIGGMVPETTGWLMERLDGLWGDILTTADGSARVKVHGFGLTDQKLMFRYPWHSVDSSSWLMTGIYGACMLMTPSGPKKIVFSEDSPEARKFKGWHFKNLAPVQQEQVREWLLPYKITAEQLGENYRFRNVVNAVSFQEMEKLMTTKFVARQNTLFGLV